MRIPFDDLNASMSAPDAVRSRFAPVDTRIISRCVEADSVVSLELAIPAGYLSEPPTPGAHVDLYLKNGMMRQYSLVRWSAASLWIAVKLEENGRGGSRCLFEAQTGDELELGAIRNSFALHPDVPESVLIAGGIGITPFIAMAEKLQEEGTRWTLYYAAKGPDQAPFLAHLQQFGDRVRFAGSEQGRFDLQEIVRSHDSGAHFYACGPESLLESFRSATRALSPEQVHLEHFGAVAPAADAGAFVVELARSGFCVDVPASRTVLQALVDRGVAIAHSCEQGICGQCEVTVLSGIPDHRDDVLSAEEKSSNRTLMVCCSRSLSPRLVLDC